MVILVITAVVSVVTEVEGVCMVVRRKTGGGGAQDPGGLGGRPDAADRLPRDTPVRAGAAPARAQAEGCEPGVREPASSYRVIGSCTSSALWQRQCMS